MDCAYCKYVNFETSNPQDRNKLLNKPFVTQHTVINGNEMFELELNLGYFRVVSRREINNCPMCGEKLHKIEKIEKGDLVIKKGKNEARTYFVEDIDEFGILLVDGIQDMYYEEDELYKFYQQYRLLVKAKDFVDFLRLEFINLGYDEDIVKCLEEQNWNVALAYMLNEEKEKDSTGNTFVI